MVLEGDSGCLGMGVLRWAWLLEVLQSMGAIEMICQWNFLSSFLPSILFPGQRGSKHSDINFWSFFTLVNCWKHWGFSLWPLFFYCSVLCLSSDFAIKCKCYWHWLWSILIEALLRLNKHWDFTAAHLVMICRGCCTPDSWSCCSMSRGFHWAFLPLATLRGISCWKFTRSSWGF